MSNDMLGKDNLNGLFESAKEAIAPTQGLSSTSAKTPLAPRPQQIPYKDMSYLVVEDSNTMRAWLRTAIADAGGVKIDMSESYFDALNRIKRKGDYDIVLCDYILSDTRDGQQLLEEVRRNKLLPQSTLWIMITGEQGYEQVFSAAELAPDDYLIKPITPAILADRIAKAWDRRNTLKVATALFDGGRFPEAYDICLKMIKEGARFSIGFRRIAGECLLSLNRYQEARDHYEAVLEEFPRLPWAKLGKGRAFFNMDLYDETQEILEDLVASTPDFLQAHDLLARVHEHKGNLEQSRDLLKLVLEKNPKALHRHRDVVRVATATGDTETAVEAYALMHQHGRGSSFLRPGDFCEYAGLLMNSGSKAAKDRLDALMSGIRDFHRDDPEFSFSQHMVAYAMGKASGNRENAKMAYMQMRHMMLASKEDDTAIDGSEYLAMLAAAADMGDPSMVEECARALYADHLGNTRMVDKINAALGKAGMSDVAERFRVQAAENLKQLNMAAIQLAKHGQYKEAINEFMRLAETNKNVMVFTNAATAIIKLYENVAAGKQMVSKAEHKHFTERIEHCADYIRKHDPGNVKIAMIMTEWKTLTKGH